MTRPLQTACLVLASGLSKRYGPDDKLLAELKGKALLAYCLDAAKMAGFDGLYVITPQHDPRAELAMSRGYTIIDNPAPKAGQGASIAYGATYMLQQSYDAAVILLGDMPFVTAAYLKNLKRHKPNADIVFSTHHDRRQPPAIFNRKALAMLTELTGDKGAQSLDLSDLDIDVFELPDELARDFDKTDDFKRVDDFKP